VDGDPAVGRAVEKEGAERDGADQHEPPVEPRAPQAAAARRALVAPALVAARVIPAAVDARLVRLVARAESCDRQLAEHERGRRDEREVGADRHPGGGRRRADDAAREHAERVARVEPRQQRPAGAPLQLDALHVHRHVAEAVRERHDRERAGERRQRRRVRHRDQREREDREAEPQHRTAAVPRDERAGRREARDRPRLQAEHREAERPGGEPEVLLDRRDPRRPRGGDEPGEDEQRRGGAHAPCVPCHGRHGAHDPAEAFKARL